MRTVFIIPYFGQFPNYFDLFLKSCEHNKSFDWMIFTDNTVNYAYPENVKKISMTFDECSSLVKSKFDFEISLSSYKKLCDFRAAYGYVFQEYIKDYDFWGYCDTDIIFGDLSKFLTEDVLNKYDKIYSLGHLTLYRNTYENNTVFMRELNGRQRYKEVFLSPEGCAFDEWYPDSINDIYLQENIPFLKTSYCADIYPYRSKFVLDIFEYKNRAYHLGEEKNNIFKWENGAVIRYFYKDGKINTDEHIYIHLQKRKMHNKIKNNANEFYIAPNKFTDGDLSAEKLLKRSDMLAFLNFQYIKVKYKSLKQRLKNNDWSGFVGHRNIKREK